MGTLSSRTQWLLRGHWSSKRDFKLAPLQRSVIAEQDRKLIRMRQDHIQEVLRKLKENQEEMKKQLAEIKRAVQNIFGGQ